MTHAPHLPPKSCNINTHRKVQSLPWLLVFLVLSILSGATTALSVVSWVMPNYWSDTSVYIRDRHNTTQQAAVMVMDPMLKRQINQHMLSVYDNKQLIGAYYPSQAKIADVAMLSSNGWAVTYMPEYQSGQEKNWQVFDVNGEIVGLERALFDARTGLLYVKVVGTSFSVFSFADFDAVQPSNSVWSLSAKGWQHAVIADVQTVLTGKSVSLLDTQEHYVLDGVFTDAQVVLSEQGQLLGFSTKNQILIPEYWIADQLPHILAKGSIEYTSFPLKGYFVEKRIQGNGSAAVSGFYISEVMDVQLKKTLIPGDVILAIDGKPVTALAVPSLFLKAPENVPLQILRDGSVKELLVKKQQQSV